MRGKKIAFLFPGQGSQVVGMGKALSEKYGVAAETFEEANDILGFDLRAICFDGPEETLQLTENLQPALLTTSVAVWRSLQKETAIEPAFVAGHSLGEYSALVAAGALAFEDAVRLTRIRGRAMQEAVPVGKGAMSAILGLSPKKVTELCMEVSSEGEPVVPANLNSSIQTVVSGHAGAVERVMEVAKKGGAKRVVRLPVSAPFHSPLMAPAADRMAEALEKVLINPLRVPYVANVDAALHHDPSKVKSYLLKQVTAPVLWESSMTTILEAGCEMTVEIGPGTVLTSLARRMKEGLVTFSVHDPESLLHLLKALGSRTEDRI